MRYRDLTGQRLGRLTIVRIVQHVSHGQRLKWWCVCSCGNEKVISSKNLLHPNKPTRSCGCIQRELMRSRKTTHGMSGTAEKNIYNTAKQRCTNLNNARYKDYGGRGIKFLFTSFEQFFAELGKRPTSGHSLDRKNNDGHYESGNVRWATKKEQADNRAKNRALRNFSTEELLTELKKRGFL